jgi:simple sugar transport system substrate-binding protein
MIDSGQDPAEIKNRVLAYLNPNPDTDAVLTLGPTSADPTLLALDENGMAGDIYFGTFDLGDNIVEGIKAAPSTGASTSSPSCRPICRSWC